MERNRRNLQFEETKSEKEPISLEEYIKTRKKTEATATDIQNCCNALQQEKEKLQKIEKERELTYVEKKRLEELADNLTVSNWKYFLNSNTQEKTAIISTNKSTFPYRNGLSTEKTTFSLFYKDENGDLCSLKIPDPRLIKDLEGIQTARDGIRVLERHGFTFPEVGFGWTRLPQMIAQWKTEEEWRKNEETKKVVTE